MIARMLNICGLYLGPEEELHAAQADNPEGFWENMRFQDINDRILEMFGGAWDAPPRFPDGWHADPRLEPLKKEAAALCAEFGQHGEWGWKDPRNSLTLPFWKEIIPGLKVLVAVRHPLDVAASLSKRGYASQIFGIELWDTYMAAAEKDSPPDPTLYTHYASYFAAAPDELKRVNDFCGLTPSDEQFTEACGTVSGGLRHSDSTFSGLFATQASLDVIRRYLEACILSGPIYERLVREETSAVIVPKLQAQEKLLKQREERLASLEKDYEARYEKRFQDEKDRALDTEQKLRTRIEELRAWQANMSGRIVEVQTLASKRAIELEKLLNQLKDLKAKADQADSFANEREVIQENRWVRLAVSTGLKVKHEGRKALIGAVARKALGIKPKAKAAPVLEAPAAEPQPAKAVTVPELLGLSETPLAKAALFSAVKAAMKYERFAFAISHDSFQAFTGGIQTVIREEMDVFHSHRISHLHFSPASSVGTLRSAGDNTAIIVSVDGESIGLATPADAKDLLADLASRDEICMSVQIHHIMNWSLEMVHSLLAIVSRARKYFWIHDYYSSCESYNLLRNDRAFCNAPPITSNSCMVCRYGPGRAGHLAGLAKLFEAWHFTFVTPSERSASVWKRTWPQYSNDLVVAPLYDLVETQKQNLRADLAGRKIRIAFPGISYVQKGWLHWRKLVDVLSGDPNYELIHMGQRTGDVNSAACPEEFQYVRRDPDNDNAMQDALVKEDIDIVFYAPIWAETFSLIAYEAYAAGCYTLTIEESGNVAAFVQKSNGGKVFPNIDLLIAYLVDIDQVRKDLTLRKKDASHLFEMVYSRSIVESTYSVAPRLAETSSEDSRVLGP